MNRMTILTSQRRAFQAERNSDDKSKAENRKTPICFPNTGSRRATTNTKIMANVNKIAMPRATISGRLSFTS
ncbi:Uncharacterised protein [Mycobacteroides abscessus subsp. abscessus]|nr:Uncharacterised protein [Mycobacteroides abscessus subsp. abscessus]